MNQLPILIKDLTVILCTAAVTTLLFKKLKQPVVLGYIVAGLLAGPHLFKVTLISDPSNISLWGEIGVIFLLFALGLEFSFKKLISLGSSAIVSSLTIIIGMMSLGFLTGRILGWNNVNSIFLGGMLCMSSTSIVYKVLDDLSLRKAQFAQLAFGILVCEDLVAILLMVLLPTIAVSKSFEGMTLATSFFTLAAYLILWFILGIFLIPTFLQKTKKYLNDETLLIVSLGLCLGMVFISTEAHFSAALGAFIMGSILAETLEAEQIQKTVRPVKDLFGAIFFVSVGMLLDPTLLVHHLGTILLLTLLVVVGQITFATIGVILSGQSLKTAIQTSFSLAQIGEFAFIIASLGLSMHVIDASLYPIIVAVSVITTFITPYLVNYSEKAYERIDNHLSTRMKEYLLHYSSGINSLKIHNTWEKYIYALTRFTTLYGILSFIIASLYFSYLAPSSISFLGEKWGKIINLLIIVTLIAPLLRAIMVKKNHSVEFKELWAMNNFNKGALIGLIVLRFFICMSLIMFIISKLYTLTFGLIFGISILLITGVVLSQKIKRHSIQLEKHFLNNLSQREQEEEKIALIKKEFSNSLLERDLHLAQCEISPNSLSIGKTLRELDLRHKKGVTIVTILRGNHHINIPAGNEHIYPYDKVIVAGTNEQIERFQEQVEKENIHSDQNQKEIDDTAEMTLGKFEIKPRTSLVGIAIGESNIRESSNCLIVAIERAGKSILNPEASEILYENDLVWMVGEKNQLVQFIQKIDSNLSFVQRDWVIYDNMKK